ncbi:MULTISPECIES: GntR family transcriptional regulator [Sphingobium]|uniref:GntR family transcriptional regulator n=1 Tax=Sphingobium TaxID=165695 RepID=UPI00159C46CF|nr:FCD domain-containing protein [Sphingobium sp. 15-1]
MKIDNQVKSSPETAAGGNDNGATRARDTYHIIKRDILECRLLPGAKLKLDQLRTRYDVGGSPLREALVRLSADGLVVLEDHRGFYVAPVSRADLVDVTKMRIMLETRALSDSIEHGSDEWESRVIGAYHYLSKTETFIDGNRIMGQDWESRHRDYHTTLVEACASPWLLRLRGLLYDQADRYRRLSLLSQRASPQSRPANTEHKQLLDTVLARDVDAACAILAKHIQKTTDILIDDPELQRYLSP